MKIKNNITTAIIAAATGMLQPFIPDLTPTRLIKALEAFEGDDQNSGHDESRPRKPYTIAEVQKLLEISKPTVYRMFEEGTLRKLKIRGLTRIPAEDVQNLLAGDRKEKPTS